MNVMSRKYGWGTILRRLFAWSTTDARCGKQRDAGSRLRLLSENLLKAGQDAECSCPRSRLRPAVDGKFAIDVAGVPLDCAERDDQSSGNFAIRIALSDEPEHLQLALTERFNQ